MSLPYQVIGYHHFYLESAASLYQQAYAVPDGERFNSYELSREIVVDHSLRDSFLGVLAINADQQVIGFAWGYAAPTNHPRISEIIRKRLGQEWLDSTFVIEGFAMHFEHGDSLMIKALFGQLLRRAQNEGYQRVRMRINIPRFDDLPRHLGEAGWEVLQGLSHVLWMGKRLA